MQQISKSKYMRLGTIIRDRFTIARDILSESETKGKSYADGYFKGWFDATMLILTAIDKTDFLNPPNDEEAVRKMVQEAGEESDLILKRTFEIISEEVQNWKSQKR